MIWTSEMEKAERLRVSELMKDPNNIFVFGSNLAGIHGAGAAREAHQKYGAVWGVGKGMQSNSYAFPTKDKDLKTLSEYQICCNTIDLIVDARNFGEKFGYKYVLTRVGCGLAGFEDEDMVRLFTRAVIACSDNLIYAHNIIYPPIWLELLDGMLQKTLEEREIKQAFRDVRDMKSLNIKMKKELKETS